MKIKLKMGKDEDKSEESDEETNSAEETTEEKAEPEEDTKKEPTKELSKAEEKKEDEDQKKDTDELRKIIKVGSKEGEEEKQETSEKKEETPKQEAPAVDDSSPRDSLEQKRAILQSIKDFDFQIKKNQEGIGSINQKMESVSKDLDDLVSLYEIVSEQMNPFVGLSKVTKKRIDALENFTKEIEDLKDRTGELESFAEKSGARIKNLGELNREKAKTIDAEGILGDEGEETEGSENIEELEKTEDAEKLEETGEAKKEADIETAEQKSETTQEEVEQQSTIPEEPVQPDMPQGLQTQFTDDKYQITEQQTYQSDFEYNSWESLSDDDLDMIIERTLGGSSPERKIDMIIDEFIESLKG